MIACVDPVNNSAQARIRPAMKKKRTPNAAAPSGRPVVIFLCEATEARLGAAATKLDCTAEP